jgi:uncharacterized protein
MLNPKTPGVYIQEISKLPASVAPVATAIPAFVGYTEKNIRDGETIPVHTPTRITSLLEYNEIFGGAFDEKLNVTLTGLSTEEEDTNIAVAASALSFYTMYYNLVMYFGNGGGPCYIVSVGNYVSTPPAKSDISSTALGLGLAALEQEDEVTLLVIPEAVVLDQAPREVLNDAMLTQCNKLQDRFAIMDALVLGGTVKIDGDKFRDDVGIGNLKYGAAYYPSIKTAVSLNFEDNDVSIVDNRSGGSFGGLKLTQILEGNTSAVAASGTITIVDASILTGDTITINGTDYVAGTSSTGDFDASGTAIQAADKLILALAGDTDIAASRAPTTTIITITATATGLSGNSIDLGYDDTSNTGDAVTLSGSTLSGGSLGLKPDKTLYNNIVKEIQKNFEITLYPSSTIAGVYARVDNNRGVWKAPANVSLFMVKDPTVLVTHEQQGELNVDATSGKSINVIRKFAGKGSIVWGARTLAGNDNEWRYVPVRRLYIFVEESVKKATEFVVFEPNDAKTWLRTKTMIENFLSGLWRDGALAGAKPDEAFFVKVGLGQTMTALDILEGRMNIEIGMAAVRPAEFIILKFSHKMQES